MLSVNDLPAVELPERPIVLAACGDVLLMRHKQPAFETDQHSNPFLQLCVKLGPSHLQTETIEGHDPFLLQLALTLMSGAESGVSGAYADIFAKAAIARLFSAELASADAMDALTCAIKFRIDHPWSVEEMADYAGLSPHHFSRRFKEKIGQSPYKYLLQQRVERAAELLAGTPRSVAAVAQEVGFASQGQLNHHFRRVYGSTPTLFRQKRTKREIQSTI